MADKKSTPTQTTAAPVATAGGGGGGGAAAASSDTKSKPKSAPVVDVEANDFWHTIAAKHEKDVPIDLFKSQMYVRGSVWCLFPSSLISHCSSLTFAVAVTNHRVAHFAARGWPEAPVREVIRHLIVPRSESGAGGGASPQHLQMSDFSSFLRQWGPFRDCMQRCAASVLDPYGYLQRWFHPHISEAEAKKYGRFCLL